MNEAQRQQWQSTAKAKGLTLHWDPQAIVHLSEARQAFQAQQWKKAQQAFAQAQKAHANITDQDVLNWGIACLESGDSRGKSQAQKLFLNLPAQMRSRSEFRDYFARADLMSPRLKPKVITLTWVGGDNNQWFPSHSRQ